MSIRWTAPTDPETVRRRAAGRRRYNAQRRFKAELRRGRVAHLLAEEGGRWGAQARVARRLGVHPSTISRDVDVLLARSLAEEVCAFCGQRLIPNPHPTDEGCRRGSREPGSSPFEKKEVASHGD